MATISEQIAALEAAMAQGVTRVTYDGQTVEYRAQADMERAIAYLRAKQRQATGKRAVNVSVGAVYR